MGTSLDVGGFSFRTSRERDRKGSHLFYILISVIDSEAQTINQMKNENLYKANKAKKDEFYTQLTDIENELKHYKEFFRDKTVLCNCDDPRVSNFFRYFTLNFRILGLKKVITTCYKSQHLDLFSENKSENAISIEYNGEMIDNRIPNVNEIGINKLKGDGDFSSIECINLLKQSDVVVTNPPFSLFRKYVALLMKYNKKFLIIGNMNASTYKECFKLIKDNKMWMGASIHSGDREFGVPQDYPLKAAGCRIDNGGNKFIRVKGVRWFTNIDYIERHEDIVLYKTYKNNEEDYPKYDNYNAININKTADIPCDYDGVMGVPITFLDKYNPEQFELIGIDRYVEDNPNYGKRFTINQRETYARILIKNKRL